MPSERERENICKKKICFYYFKILQHWQISTPSIYFILFFWNQLKEAKLAQEDRIMPLPPSLENVKTKAAPIPSKGLYLAPPSPFLRNVKTQA